MQHLYAALAIALFAGPGTPALASQPFGNAEIEKLRAAGLPVAVVEGEIAAQVLADLRRHGEIDADPTWLVFVFADQGAAIGLIFGDTLCGIVSGPARETLEMLRHTRDQASCCAATTPLRQTGSRVQTKPFQFWSSAMQLIEAMGTQAPRRRALPARASIRNADEATARAERLDLPAIAQRLRDIADRSERIRLPSARKPHIFHEDMSEWHASIRVVARQLAGR